MNSIMTPGVLGSNVTIQCAAMFFWTVGARGRRGWGGADLSPTILAGVKAKPFLQKTYRIVTMFNHRRSVNFEMFFWCLQLLPKNKRKKS